MSETFHQKNMFQRVAVLWIILICSLTMLTCNSNSLGGSERFFAVNHEVQMFYAKDFSFFSVENVRGNIAVTNTDGDSIKISVDRFASSALDETQAELYLSFASARMDTVIQDSAFYKTDMLILTTDMSISVDLIIEIPSFLDLTTNILSEGDQIIDIAIPKNSTGNLLIVNNMGDITLTLDQSSSFVFAAQVISGTVLYENLDPADFSIGTGDSEDTIQRTFNDGTGRVIAAIASGTLRLIGKN